MPPLAIGILQQFGSCTLTRTTRRQPVQLVIEDTEEITFLPESVAQVELLEQPLLKRGRPLLSFLLQPFDPFE